MTSRILIVDDDFHIRGVVRIAAETAGMQTNEAANGLDALTLVHRHKPDLVVLDVGMPGMNGFDCCKQIRNHSRVPILFLTAHDDEVDRILGFELGGDDFVAKPFSPRELMLRIKAILSRGGQQTEELLRYGDLQLNGRRHACMLGSHELAVTSTEFALLALLARHPGTLMDRNTLIAGVYGQNNSLSGRTIDSHVRNIRAKASKLGCTDVIRTVHGVGLRLGDCLLRSPNQ
ncbi:response regulator transcription factor [uncultured Roseibium sp.]|uniref:response regulator transcription factor n=1 Tax=uncultured Roseibium sp. TaxID=1936171 RepID=UPI002636908A|nr:response regulator transcription factor [uncultured Roseibium sp.]